MNKKLSNLITPPDFVKSKNYSVVLVDPTWVEVDTVALYLQSVPRVFNVYIYKAEMDNEEWLYQSVIKSDTVVVNTVNTTCSESFKSKLASNPKNFYYGPTLYAMNTKNQIWAPVDFFVNFTQQPKENNVTK